MSKIAEILAPGSLADDGAIGLNTPCLGGREWEYVKSCLDTGWVSSVGRFVDRFEAELAARIGVKYAVATVNGTAALHASLLACGVAPDDEVLVSSLTFIAPANAIRYAGAWPVFIDAERDYWQMAPDAVRAFLENDCICRDGLPYNRQSGRRVTAIMPVHILGHAVDIDPIIDVGRKFGLKIIEDATEALGAEYKGRPVGGQSDAACFSFNGNKIITTGGGGMIVTDDESIARKAKYLTTQAKDDPVEYVHGEIGYNYRLTNVLAAMGCAQLEQLDGFIARKRAIATAYAAGLRDLPGVTLMPEAPWAKSTFWQYTVLIDPEPFGADSRQVIAALNDRKIQTRPLWQPIHQSKAHARKNVARLSVAEDLNRRGVSLPCSVSLTAGEQQRVIGALRELHNARRHGAQNAADQSY